MPHPYWPLFDLVVHTPRLTLRYLDDECAVAMAALAGRGIHDPAYMPFAMPWSDACHSRAASLVIPAQAGIQFRAGDASALMNSCFHRNDGTKNPF